MNQNPKISVIIPYYNTNINLLVECIESILSQSYINWELIVVNDGCTASNKSLIEKYLNDLKIKDILLLHHNKNLGVAAARNTGIKYTTGEIITFLAADDLYLPWHLEEIIENFSNHPFELILTSEHVRYIRIWKLNNILYDRYFLNLLRSKTKTNKMLTAIKEGNCFIPSKLVFKKEVFNIIRYDETLQVGEDTELIFQILNSEELINKIAVVPLTGHLYRLSHSSRNLSNKKKLLIEVMGNIIERYKGKNNLAGKASDAFVSYNKNSRFNYFLTDCIWDGSLLKSMLDILDHSNRTKRIILIKRLVRIFINYTLYSLFSLDERFSLVLIKGKEKKFIKNLLQKHITELKDENQKLYSKKTFQTIFN